MNKLLKKTQSLLECRLMPHTDDGQELITNKGPPANLVVFILLNVYLLLHALSLPLCGPLFHQPPVPQSSELSPQAWMSNVYLLRNVALGPFWWWETVWCLIFQKENTLNWLTLWQINTKGLELERSRSPWKLPQRVDWRCLCTRIKFARRLSKNSI